MSLVTDILEKQKEETDAQEEANAYLMLLNDIRGHAENLLLEQMITNENTEGINSSLKAIGKSISNGIASFTSAVKGINIPEGTDEVEEAISSSPVFNVPKADPIVADLSPTINVDPVTSEIAPVGKERISDISTPEIIQNITQDSVVPEIIQNITQDAITSEIAPVGEGKKLEQTATEVIQHITQDPITSKIAPINAERNLDTSTPEIIQSITPDTASSEIIPVGDEESSELLEDTTEKMLFHLMRMDKRGAEEEKRRKAASVSEEGFAASVGGKPEGEDKGGGILESMSSMFGFKMPKMPKGMGKILTGVKTIGKVIGKVAIVVGAVIAIFDFIKGAFDGDTLKSITGKNKEDLSVIERIMSGISNVIEGLTFGLLSAKKVFDFVKPLTKGLEDAVEFLFDPKTGTFASLVQGFIKVKDLFSSGDITGGLLEAGKQLLLAPMHWIEGIGKTIVGMFSEDGIFGFVGGWFKSDGIFGLVGDQVRKIQKLFAGGDVLGGLFESVKAFVAVPAEFISSITSKVADFILDFLPEGMKSFFKKRGEEIDDVKNFASDTLSSVTDSIGNFFGGSDDKDKQPVVAVTQPPSLERAIIKPKPDGAQVVPVAIKNESVNLSKERLDAQQITVQAPAPQTIILPAQKSDEPKVIRRSSADDMGLAFQNAGFSDGI